ncbi:MAG: hypothetical protein EBR62_03290 [Verrucomicrobia bacterium]|nr:hypothetical protein [Verrucomicrobiota bacterium]
MLDPRERRQQDRAGFRLEQAEQDRSPLLVGQLAGGGSDCLQGDLTDRARLLQGRAQGLGDGRTAGQGSREAFKGPEAALRQHRFRQPSREDLGDAGLGIWGLTQGDHGVCRQGWLECVQGRCGEIIDGGALRRDGHDLGNDAQEAGLLPHRGRGLELPHAEGPRMHGRVVGGVLQEWIQWLVQ